MNGTQQFFFFLGGWKRQRTQQKLKGNKRIQTGSKQTDHLNFVFPCSNFHSILCTHWATKRKNIGFMSCQPSLWLLYYWFYYIKLSYSHHQQPLPRKSQYRQRQSLQFLRYLSNSNSNFLFNLFDIQ